MADHWFCDAAMPAGMMVEVRADLPTLELPAVTEDANRRWRERWRNIDQPVDVAVDGEW